MVNVDPVGALKERARILHRQAQKGAPDALARFAKVRELGPSPDPASILRRHALSVLALELGFSGFKHASDVLSGQPHDDAGKLLYPDDFGGALWNVWCATYEEAKAIRDERDGFLFPYRRQSFVAERYFVEALGLDPEDEAFTRIGRDWVRPRDRAAWSQLVTRLVEQRLA